MTRVTRAGTAPRARARRSSTAPAPGADGRSTSATNTVSARAAVVDGAAFFAGERLRWSEREFQREVLALARDLGWTHRYHTYFSDRSEVGFPDLVLVRPAQVIFVELKTMRGRLTAAQESWIDALRAGRAEVYLWRPCCWNSGEIEGVLR